MMTRVLVLGATGDQGHPLLTRLMDAGFTPVAALRNPDALQSVTNTLSFEGLATKVNPQLYIQIAKWLTELRSKPVREVLQILKS